MGWKMAIPKKGAGLIQPITVPNLSAGETSRIIDQTRERVVAITVPIPKKIKLKER
jgi:hypothetical protein